MKTGALVRPSDRYFNFSEHGWKQWPYSTTIVRRGNDITTPWFIRRNRNRKRQNEKMSDSRRE